MLFKGTSKKSSFEIVKFIEGLGGSFDAYTSKENLVIITKFLSEHLNNVFGLICELLFESKIEQEEFNKEKKVILEEIKTGRDDPQEHIFDLFFKSLFPKHPIGRPIAGTVESVKNINLRMTRAHYHRLLKRKITIAISGNFDHHRLIELAEKKFSSRKFLQRERKGPIYQRGKIIVQPRDEISQVHFIFGLPGLPFSSPKRYQLSIMNTAFGGGMSSRLFQGLREEIGLVYNVQSFLDMYEDCGVIGFYFACDKKNLPRITKRLKKIFQDIKENGFKREEVELAKTYLSGNLLLSLESSTNRMLRLARSMIYLNRIKPISEVIKEIRAVSTEQINELSKQYLNPASYTVAAIGPIDKKEAAQIQEAIIN